jgi:hypothetical protein
MVALSYRLVGTIASQLYDSKGNGSYWILEWQRHGLSKSLKTRWAWLLHYK